MYELARNVIRVKLTPPVFSLLRRRWEVEWETLAGHKQSTRADKVVLSNTLNVKQGQHQKQP